MSICIYPDSQTDCILHMAWLSISHLALNLTVSSQCHSWSTELVLNQELFVLSIYTCRLLYSTWALLLLLKFIVIGLLLQLLPTPMFDALCFWQFLLAFGIWGYVYLLVSSEMWFALYFLLFLLWSELDPCWAHGEARKAHSSVSTCQPAFLIVM